MQWKWCNQAGAELCQAQFQLSQMSQPKLFQFRLSSLKSSSYHFVCWGYLPVIVFLWGCLLVRLYSCVFIFLWDSLPARLSYCKIFRSSMWGCFHLGPSFSEVVFLHYGVWAGVYILLRSRIFSTQTPISFHKLKMLAELPWPSLCYSLLHFSATIFWYQRKKWGANKVSNIPLPSQNLTLTLPPKASWAS